MINQSSAIKQLFFALSFVAWSAAYAVVPPSSDAEPVGSTVPIGSNDLFSDTEPRARLAAFQERFGAYLSEPYKQSLLQSLQSQRTLYGNLLPGGSAPPNMPTWRSLGPTNAKYETNGVTLKVVDSGRVRTILQSPVDPDTVYVLTSGGGLWKTNTFSHTKPKWEPKTDALQSTSGGGVAFGRTPDVLYLGLGDPFNYFPTLGGVIAKSLDGGNSWQPLVNLPGASTVSEIKVDTSGPVDIVLVATDAGLYRSVDGGTSFALVATVAGQQFWSLAKTSAGWLATTAVYGSNGVDPGRMLYSTDRGATWRFIPNVGNGFSNAGRATLGIAASGDSIVYAIAANTDGFAQRDLFKSVDGGLNWVALGITGKTPTNPDGWQPTMNLLGGQGWYGQMILVDANDRWRNTVYLGGQLSTAKTIDGGNTWTLQSDWLPGIYSNLPYVHADHHVAASIALNGQRAMVFGTDGGIFVSADGGASFAFDKNEGIVSGLTQTVASSTKNPQSLITGMQDTGSRARMGASGFYNQVTGGDGEGVGWSQANNAYTLTSVPGCYFSSPGLLPNTRGDWHRFCLGRPLFFAPLMSPTSKADSTGLIFFGAATNGPLITVDGGLHWSYFARAGRNLPSNFRVREGWHVVSWDPVTDLNNTLPIGNFAVAGYGARLAITIDGGYHWFVKALLGIVPGFQGYITSPAWTANGTLYVASESPIAGSVRVLKSPDLGNNFSRADFGLPDAGVYQVLPDPSDASGNTVFAATLLGVYRTIDGGASWTRFGAGLPGVLTTGLSISEDGSLLRAATYGRGVWEINSK